MTVRAAIALAAGGMAAGTVPVVMVVSPAAAAEPHDLSRTDQYTTRYYRDEGGTRECTFSGRNTLLEDGDASVVAHTFGEECPAQFAAVVLEIAYVDSSGTPVAFTVEGGGGIARASLTGVESDLQIRYHARFDCQPCWSDSPIYKLPK